MESVEDKGLLLPASPSPLPAPWLPGGSGLARLRFIFPTSFAWPSISVKRLPKCSLISLKAEARSAGNRSISAKTRFSSPWSASTQAFLTRRTRQRSRASCLKRRNSSACAVCNPSRWQLSLKPCGTALRKGCLLTSTVASIFARREMALRMPVPGGGEVSLGTSMRTGSASSTSRKHIGHFGLGKGPRSSPCSPSGCCWTSSSCLDRRTKSGLRWKKQRTWTMWLHGVSTASTGSSGSRLSQMPHDTGLLRTPPGSSSGSPAPW
mmetsp:Transcript_9105/g.26566  ORF Transcript_9105/g.26566 Transcript_9105/m.26566 type:complete len:265 (+) Transcript_9105:441-1235(+)